ncbi:helix-turn-helix domain-containing protein [Aestuariibius sp. 2305UL40-4]|uniref:AraC family transcriptional regulator n=1 Tax=Aestuariibius violaceus TaxID=3234132 RepID=UPI00345E0DF8
MPGLIAQTTALPAGGGGFALPALTIGVFGADQPGHRLAVGGDRAQDAPLTRHQGWILPAGAEGTCLYDAPMDVTMVSLETSVLEEAGLQPGAALAPVVGDLDPVLLHLALRAETFGAGGTLYRETMHRAVAAQIVQVMQPVEAPFAAIDDIRLRRVAEWIEDNLAEDISIKGMADLAAMSSTHFAKAFKTATGASPLQYVIARRCERALVLLRSTSLPVAEIAYRVGYNDVPRFGQHFKRRFGHTPGQARAG